VEVAGKTADYCAETQPVSMKGSLVQALVVSMSGYHMERQVVMPRDFPVEIIAASM
jgi:hypothetical protein